MPRKRPPPKPPEPGTPEQERLAAALDRLNAGGPAGEVHASGDFDYLGDRLAAEVRKAAVELALRRCEALHLYEPLPLQAEFHASRARRRILRGGNRSGKTVASAVEVARAVTGQDPFKKYPTEDGRCYVVGLDLMHVSQVFYRNLFRPGAFKMIRDEATRKWRAYRPYMPEDVAREREAKWAPPLIPPRFVQSVAWEEKAKSIPRLVKLRTGWELAFFSSQAKPPQGMQVDVVWFDEELDDEEWYPEMAARLMDRRGLLIWSAAPQAGNDQLMVLSERADRERGLPPFERTVEEYVILTADNPHIPESEKRVLAADLTDEQYDVRVSGEFAAKRWKVFPEFQPAVHVREVPDVPPHWTRYAMVDPGRQVCAVLFAAVPDPAERQPFEAVLYDELYIRDCSAAVFGERMAEKCAGQDFELFVIDWQMGRQTQIGTGETVELAYAKALKANRVRCRRSGHGFAWADSNVRGGLEQVRGWLRVNPRTDCPRLVVREGTCPNLRDEIKRYRFKRVNRVVTDDPETRGAVHQMANLRYFAGCGPRFVRRAGAAAETGALKAFRERERRRRRQAGEAVVKLGPGR